jgi:Flp pilus assembly pilin Flp
VSSPLSDEAGTVTVEYAVVLALVAVGFTIAVAGLATRSSRSFACNARGSCFRFREPPLP